MTDQTTAIAVRSEPELGITPRTIAEAKEMCGILLSSGLLPNEIKTPQAAFAILQYGAEIGLKPMTALRQIFVVKGKPAPSAQLMHGMALKHQDCEYFRVSDEDERAVVKVRRKSWPPGEFDTFTYSRADAETAGLWGSGTWRNHPKAMLRNRAIAAAARAVFPDVLANMYEPDEVANFSEPAAQQRPAQDARPASQREAQNQQQTVPDVVDGEMVSSAPKAAGPDHSGAAKKLSARLKAEKIDRARLNAYLKVIGRPTLPDDVSDAAAAAFGGLFFGGGGLEDFRSWEKANPATSPGGARDALYERLADQCGIDAEAFDAYLKAAINEVVKTDADAEQAEAWFFGDGDGVAQLADFQAWAAGTASADGGADPDDEPIPF